MKRPAKCWTSTFSRESHSESSGHSLLVALPEASTLLPPDDVTIFRRPNDWGLSRRQRARALLRWTLRVVSSSHRHRRVVLITAGWELLPLGLLLGSKVLAVDWLMPSRSTPFDRLIGRRRVRFLAIRRSDIATLARRYGVSEQHARFIKFPAPEVVGGCEEGTFFYSAGWAHRDWPTLGAAQQLAGCELVIAAPADLPEQTNLTVVGPVDARTGREMMRRSRGVVLPFVDTSLPSGPLVLLDALAHGKATIVSDVGGTRDYVIHSVNALVVPPGDAAAMAAAMLQLDTDVDLRRRLGQAARESVSGWGQDEFWAAIKEAASAE